MLTYLNCFNTVKLALLKKNKFTYIEINRKNTIIITLLLKYNVVLGFKIININNKNIYVVYVNSAINYLSIKNLHKISNPRFVKYKDLKFLSNKNTGTKYILSTSKGFIDIKEALHIKIGGILLFKIN